MPLPAGIDPSQLPAFSLTPANDEPRSKPNPIIGGLASGFHELLGLGGSAVYGIGKLEGFQDPIGKGFADNQQRIAARVGRPDLEVAPWQPGGASIAPWLTYQASKLIPTLAGYAAATALAPEAAVPAGLARAGAVLPEFLGGAGLEAGAGFAARKAALATGTNLGKFVIGGGAFGATTGFGQAIQSADQKPGGVTVQDAVQAAAESPLYAAAGLIEPGFLRGAMRGAEGKLLTRVAARALGGAAVGSVQAGALAGLDQTFRPDLSTNDKMANIVDAAVTGASVGGLIGGITGIRSLKRANPAAIDNDTLAGTVDQALDLGQAGQNIGRLALPAPPAFVDSMGRTVMGSGGDATLRATPAETVRPEPGDTPQAAPALFGPEAVPDRAAVPGSTIVVGRRGEQGRFTNEATGVEQPPVVPDDTSRAFRNFTDAELASAGNALANKRESEGRLTPEQNQIARGIDDELAFRRNGTLTSDAVNPAAVEAVSASANRRGTGEFSDAPASASTDNVASRISELTQGLRLPTTLKERLATARSEHDIQDIVHDEVIVAGKGGKMRDALAQRVGMLDDEGRPTPMADEVSARKTPAGERAPTPAMDAMFLQRWKDDVKTTGQKDPAVRALKPTSEEDAQTQIYRALGYHGVKSDADGLEKLAQKYGVLDDNKQLTPLALEIAKRDPIATEDAVKAAQAQGFKGAAASMFDRGVQAHVSGGDLITKFESTRAGEAYQAGVKWAEDRNSVPKGALKKYEPSSYTGEVTDEQRALGQKVEVKKAEIPPEVRQGQLVNEAIDNAGLNPTKNEGDIAQLKSMVRSGDIEGAMEGLRRVQRGESLFEQPERASQEPFKGETVTRGAPKTQRGAELVPTKAATRAEAEKAIHEYQLGEAISNARAQGVIDQREMISLLAKLHSGKTAEVTKALPFVEFDPRRSEDIRAKLAARKLRLADLEDAMREAERQETIENEVPELSVDRNGVIRNEQAKVARRDFLAGLAATAAAIHTAPVEAALKFTPVGKPLLAVLNNGRMYEPTKALHVLEHLKTNSADPSYRMIAAKLLRGDAKGWDNVDIQLLPDSEEARGATTLNEDGSSSVAIYGTDGLNEQTILHELIHAYVQQRWGGLSVYLPENKRLMKDSVDRHDNEVAHFRDLIWPSVGLAMDKASPGIVDRDVWAQASKGDADELLSWALTNPDAQAFLKGIDMEGNRISVEKSASQKTVWDHIVDFFRELFGLNKSTRSALDEVLSAGYAVLDAGASVRTGDFNVKLAAEMRRENLENQQRKTIASSSPPAYAERTRDTIGSVVDAVDKHVDLEGAKGVLRRGQLYATTIHHITEFYGKPWFGTKIGDRDVNGVVQREQAIDFKEAIQQRHAQLITDVMDRLYALNHDKGSRKSFENINELAQYTQFGIHPARDFESQIKTVRENPAMKPLWEKAQNLYRSLQAKGHDVVYNDLKKFNDTLMLMQRSMMLHDHVSADKVTQGRIEQFAVNPMRRFMDEQAREGYGLPEAYDFWNRELDAQTAAMKDFSDRYETGPLPQKQPLSERRDTEHRIKTLRDISEGVKQLREQLDAFPNFHLGRDGDYIVDMKLRVGKDGKVDPEAMTAAAERLKEFGKVVAPESSADHIFFRVDSTVAQANLMKAAEKLQKEGIVRADRIDEKSGTRTYGIISGKRSDDRVQSALANQWSNRLLEEIDANERLTPEDRNFLKGAIRAQALDLLPDNNIAKVMTHRNNVPGFDPDMFRSYNSRAKIAIDAAAGMAVARDLTDSYANMRFAVQQAKGTPSARMSIAQRNGMTEVVDELSKRDKQFSDQPRGSKALNQLQAMSGAFFLSANLAYPAVNLIQVPMIALPELGSRHGFLKSAQAIGRATPEALKIIRAIANNGRKVSLSRAADAVLTIKALKDAGISGHKAEFIMQVANRGGFDIGGPSRELARNAQAVRGDKVDQGLRIASTLGYYSETLSRLVVGLAEYRLHEEGLPIDEMAQTTVRTLKESMWDYSSPNTARMLSRNGFLGKLTPLATQFMKYTAMLNEKLYREVHAAMGGDKVAQKFLVQHLAMTTVFAGTLGLPFASVFASTYDRLKDWFDGGDQPSDIQASFRNGLADMFGKGVAEVIARGAPRAAGIDLSTRVGEQDILPFSKFIADRRDLKDSLKDLESRAWGAPSSMMLNMATGAGRVAQGDLEGGFRQMLPLGLSSMVKAYQMTDKGFTDSKGNVLPMEPSARDILAQAVGFNPAQNAEYNEARSDQMQRQGLLARQSNKLRREIVDAMVDGDRETARGLIEQAMEFDRANPSFGVLRGVAGSIKLRQQQQAVSERTRTPLGISPKDIKAPPLTRYADVEFRAQ